MPSYTSLAEILRFLDLVNLPGVPVTDSPTDLLETLTALAIRSEQVAQAKAGFSAQFTIGDTTASASTFMFGAPGATASRRWYDEAASRLRGFETEAVRAHFRGLRTLPRDGQTPPTALSLTAPEQFSMSWTTFDNVLHDARPLLGEMARTLTDAEAATRSFWPRIAEHGVGYNLLVIERVLPEDAAALEDAFGEAWGASGAPAALRRGQLYLIDMRIWGLAGTEVSESGAGRVTPSVAVLLRQDAAKAMTPFCIQVSVGDQTQCYVRSECTDGAWLYALQAAKAAITAWGIWLGHVYHWHTVTAAMQMAMFRTLPDGHPVQQVLGPQSNDLIEFDEVLLLLWGRIAPPTSVAGAWPFLVLTDAFAAGRLFSDDDPQVALARQHLDRDAFSAESDWDLFPAAGQLLEVWRLAETYARACVEDSYADDAAVAGDAALRAWRDAASDPDVGNVRGLPGLVTRAELVGVVASLVYRVTMHGISRLNRTINPQMTFVANFPPCLERSTLPRPGDDLSTEELLRYLPTTGTIGQMVDFYFIFVFSPPYAPLLPEAGLETGLLFPGGTDAPRNQALIAFRSGMKAFMDGYQGPDGQYQQWPMNIET